MYLNLIKGQIMLMAKCSQSTANEIMYYNLFECKLYLNRKNNSRSTILWLKNHFSIEVSEIKNDAPRGGKNGDFVTFEPNEKFLEIKNLILTENENKINFENQRKQAQILEVSKMVISENEKNSFLEKTKNLSNKKARAIAHNFAGRKLGFYSNEGKDKFMNLRITTN